MSMRSPIDVLAGRVGGFTKMEIAKRTVPCYKHVIEKDGEKLAVCVLVDSGKLYRFPFENAKASKASRPKRATCAARWSTCDCGSFSRVCVVMSKEPTKPSESLVQDLLAERRELKVTVERLRLELAEVNSTAGGPDPRLRELQGEIERLRYQLASARAEAGVMREERDELRVGIERALKQISDV